MAAGDQCANSIRKGGDVRRRPVLAESVHESGRKGIACSDRIDDLNGISVSLHILAAGENGAPSSAERNSDGTPTVTLGSLKAKSFGLARQSCEGVNLLEFVFVELHHVSVLQ